jgi:phenylalanyl-tRNA synthetase beta chain
VLVPLSWLRDFAPFGEDARQIAEVLDDLGLVVESLAHVGEGLDQVVVARVEEIAPIEGADKIRRVTVDAGGEAVEVVCGAWNFEVGDLVPLAPAGTVLPGGFEIARRKMKGVVSNGMLCSAKELGLSEDHSGIMVLDSGGEAASLLGAPLASALGIEPDWVFDISVEANRPDALCVAGVARDLAARLGLPFSLPEPVDPTSAKQDAGPGDGSGPRENDMGAGGPPAVEELASVEVLDKDLCPRFTARVLLGVVVGPSEEKVARRLILAGMRPLNNVVDASNYVMLELGQPTHPYDLDRLGGGGIRVRAARPRERIVTLDEVERVLGARSVGPGDDMRDCVICDAEDVAIGIGGVMGGESTAIGRGTRRVLLEAAYFDPMSIARTSKRLGLRTEASQRFERGVDPEGIDRAALRFIELVASRAPGGPEVARGALDVRGEVARPARMKVRVGRVNSLLGSSFGAADLARYLEPMGFGCKKAGDDLLEVEVPTFRPDVSREADVAEEVARQAGYSRLGRSRLASPVVGRLSSYQRFRREVVDVMVGMGAYEVWTPSLVSEEDHRRARVSTQHAGAAAPGEVLPGPREASPESIEVVPESIEVVPESIEVVPESIEVANPIAPDQSVLRRSLLPGMLRALGYNLERRQKEARLFEIGRVFPVPEQGRVAGALAHGLKSAVDEREMLGVLFAELGDDARVAATAFGVLADALGLGAQLRAASPKELSAGLHPTRSAVVEARLAHGAATLGVVGEVDPEVAEAFGLVAGGGDRLRVGWLELDLEQAFCSRLGPRVAQAISRFPTSDVDLAFEVPDSVPASLVREVLEGAGGAELEALWLFDVYRDPSRLAGARSLAFRLRFASMDRTFTDAELAELRKRCIDAVEERLGATLRS